ncbi:MAG TPA: POTRA domain-containing protein, partial [Puia sp.]|nr:POTRA domain-containing protein [Puia sp.]
MAKLTLYGGMVMLLLISGLKGYPQYPLRISLQAADSVLSPADLGIPASFKDRNACTEYVYRLPGLLQDKGFAAASIDSAHFDSAYAFIQLYIGDKFSWASVRVKPEDAVMLRDAGWSTKKITGKPARLDKIQSEELILLNYMENNGFPFARISLDSISMDRGALSAALKIEKGPLYKIDSIRIYGSSKISSAFMERYLGIPKGSIYRKEKLESISKRIRELPYV